MTTSLARCLRNYLPRNTRLQSVVSRKLLFSTAFQGIPRSSTSGLQAGKAPRDVSVFPEKHFMHRFSAKTDKMSKSGKRTRVLVMGAAGRDFHNFNTFFRDRDDYDVVAFTATQIPGIGGRHYPPALAGPLYPEGIPIYDEARLDGLIHELDVDSVVFGYSDVSHNFVMSKGQQVMAAGADFWILGPSRTQIPSSKFIVAICASRTGAGKSPTSRLVVSLIKEMGHRVVAVRHPMPYGDIKQQVAQRFAKHSDLDDHKCTIEEREEYEPFIDRGSVVYAGVDYGEILKQAEEEADIIVWDGGNNDMPFFKPDISVCVVDPQRVGHERTYHPGEANVRMADIVVLNKIDTASLENIEEVWKSIKELNPNCEVVLAACPISADDPGVIKGKRVLVVEDGPTLTHGDMKYGCGILAARRFGAKEIIDPKKFAVGEILKTYDMYPNIGEGVLPAMGYGEKQIKDLEDTINNSDAELVVCGTPMDLTRVINVTKPMVRARYEVQFIGEPSLETILRECDFKKR